VFLPERITGFTATTEAEARTLFRNLDGLHSLDVLDSLESWIADQPWRKTQGD
jgi:hypothetical protein